MGRVIYLCNAAIACALLCGPVKSQAAGFDFVVIPQAPLSYEPVFVEVSPGDAVNGDCFDDSRNRVSMTGNTIRVDLRLLLDVPPGSPCSTFAGLGSLPAGSYTVEVWYENLGKQGEKSFTVAPMPNAVLGNVRPILNISGLYWNPQRPGRGMSITQDPLTQNVFGVWYIYDEDREPTFYTFQCEGWVLARACAGRVYRVTGQFYGDLTLPSTYEATDVGNFTLGCAPALGIDMSCGFTARIAGIDLLERMVRIRF